MGENPDRRPRIAVVDDDISFREALAGWLRLIGFASTGFESAEAYLSDGDGDAWSCLLVDVNMPGRGGLELLTIVAAQDAAPPVVIISSQDDPATRAKAMEAGAADFLGKPFEPARLEAIFQAISLVAPD